MILIYFDSMYYIVNILYQHSLIIDNLLKYHFCVSSYLVRIEVIKLKTVSTLDNLNTETVSQIE